MFLSKLLAALAATLLTAGVANADGSAFTLHLDQPDYAPFEAVDFSVSGQPGQFGFLLFDSDTTPTEILPGLTVDIGFSSNFFLAPVVIPTAGALDLPYSYDCIRSGILLGVGGMISVQGVSVDPIDASLCVSNLVTLDASDSYGFCNPCDECKGGVTGLTMRYLGTSPAYVEATKAGDLGETYFAGTLQPYEVFSFVGVGSDFKLAKEIELLIDGVPGEKVHTSCSQPIGPGIVFGEFRVLEAVSKDNGDICPYQEPSGCEVGKPAVLEMLYTGSDCSASDNDQDPSKAPCTGDPSGFPTVRIVVRSGSNIYLDQSVDVGDCFLIDSAVLGDSDLENNMMIEVFDPAGGLLQTVEFHASCSQPLAVGDVFGSCQVKTFVPKI